MGSQASGDGGPYLEDAKSFLDLFNDASGQKISWAQWSYADKAEKSAALQPGACAAQAWDSTSCSGTFLKLYIKMTAPTCGHLTEPEPEPEHEPESERPSVTSTAAPISGKRKSRRGKKARKQKKSKGGKKGKGDKSKRKRRNRARGAKRRLDG